jgi:hypothetical protein
MASGHVNRANGGRTHGRTDQYCRREEIPSQLGAVHTWPRATVIVRQPNVRFRKYSVSRRRPVYPPNTPQSRWRLSD